MVDSLRSQVQAIPANFQNKEQDWDKTVEGLMKVLAYHFQIVRRALYAVALEIIGFQFQVLAISA